MLKEFKKTAILSVNFDMKNFDKILSSKGIDFFEMGNKSFIQTEAIELM